MTQIRETGSSETIRETTFNFLLFKNNLVSHKKTISHSFLEWFVGFAEGDGSFVVSQEKNSINKRLFFIIHQKEEKILHFIRSQLGFGRISQYGSYYRYVVADKTNIYRLICLFKNNLVLAKTNKRFNAWLSTISTTEHFETMTPSVTESSRLYLTCDNLGSNAWLSGFIDSEGCFNVLKQNDTRYSLGWRLRLRFILDQKNERQIFEEIKRFLGSGVINKRKEVQDMYRFSSTSLKSHEILFDYLEKHPLRTKKKIDFVRFKRLKKYIETRPQLPWAGKVLKRVERLIEREK